MKFQLTHPWGCDHFLGMIVTVRVISTHTPVRVWPLNGRNSHAVRISTHTPVRVWQNPVGYMNSCYRISTHTPVRVWHIFLSQNYSRFQFQLTHPWGCDEVPDINWFTLPISTHTPVRVWPSAVRIFCFFIVISTHTPVRVWQVEQYRKYLYNNFNSHTREGVTLPDMVNIASGVISTHTPVRVWLYFESMLKNMPISTHTPVRVWHGRIL